jgi:hypothetical protein
VLMKLQRVLLSEHAKKLSSRRSASTASKFHTLDVKKEEASISRDLASNADNVTTTKITVNRARNK